MRKIKVCAGIGDNIWLLMKLINSGERFNFELPESKPQRGKQIFDLLPQVANSAEYVAGIKTRMVMMHNIAIKKPRWSQINEQDFYLTCNGHLETGRRLESFLPDLPTTFRIDWETGHENDFELDIWFPSNTAHYIGIYSSSYAGSRNWGTWSALEWQDLIVMMHNKEPAFTFVIIGAEWDTDMTSDIIHRLSVLGVPYINTVGQPLGVVVEILKRLSYFIGFPSGLSILNETLGKRTFMFYAKQIARIINTWADPERIGSGDCKECLFCPPEQAFNWIVNEFRLLDKI